MDDPLYLITKDGLTRLLKEFAQLMGMYEDYADVMAQVHMMRSPIPRRWNAFLRTSCAACQKDIQSCEFFNPTEKNCIGSATPESVRVANFLMVETGRYKECPAIKVRNNA